MIRYVMNFGLWILFLTYSHANVSTVTSTVEKVQKEEPAFFSSVKDKIKKTWHSMTKEDKVTEKDNIVSKDLVKKKVKKPKKIVHKTKKKKKKHKKKKKTIKESKKKIKHDVSTPTKEDKIVAETKMKSIDKEALEQRKRVEKAERRRRAKRIEEERKIAMRLKKLAEDMRKAKGTATQRE